MYAAASCFLSKVSDKHNRRQHQIHRKKGRNVRSEELLQECSPVKAMRGQERDEEEIRAYETDGRHDKVSVFALHSLVLLPQAPSRVD